jgi:hypothetical protein
VFVFPRRTFLALLLSGAFLVTTAAWGQATPTSEAAPAAAERSYPEIVRVRRVEGDVRISRTGGKGKTSGAWEQAVDDLPLETGFSLVTGDGRAEIEFEDGSTVYLDKQSALSFEDLDTTDGVPHTEISLLTGTLTAHLHPAFAGEMYMVKTPTDRGRVAYPNRVYERITAYLDAVAITRLQEAGSAENNKAASAEVTVFHNNGKAVEPEGENDPVAFADWDAWVANRVGMHEEAVKDVAEISGLVESTPGLADMKDQGVFFQCAPYGTCWEPTADSDGQDDGQIAPPSAVGQGPEFRPRLSPSSVSIYAGDSIKTKVSAVALQGFAEPVGFTVELPQGFSCVAACSGQLLAGEPFLLRLASAPDLPIGSYQVPVTLSSGPLTHVVLLKVYVGLETDADFVPVDFAVDAGPVFPCGPGGYAPHLPARLPRGAGHYGGAPGYAWAVCHTGTWIYRRHMYVWVIDRRKHHHPHPPRDPHPPIRWIKTRHKDVWVPRHPDDVEGKLPLNWKYVAFHPTDKKDVAEATVKLEAKDIVGPIAETPKEYSDPPLLALVEVEPPLLYAYETGDRMGGGRLGGGTDLRFNRESHSFLLVHAVKEGGKTRMVTESLEQHRLNSPPGSVGGVHGASVGHAVNVAHAGGAAHAGGTSHGSSAPSHAASGGSHVSSGSTHASSAGGGSHASPPPPPPAAHH